MTQRNILLSQRINFSPIDFILNINQYKKQLFIAINTPTKVLNFPTNFKFAHSALTVPLADIAQENIVGKICVETLNFTVFYPLEFIDIRIGPLSPNHPMPTPLRDLHKRDPIVRDLSKKRT